MPEAHETIDLRIADLVHVGQVRVAKLVLPDAKAAEVGPVPVAHPVVDVAGHVEATVRADAFGVQADRRRAARVTGYSFANPLLAS